MAVADTPQERPIGFGRLKRKEDARFIRGKGTYLDDIRLPGMLHGAILRSPYAHARIVSIDTSAALAHPNVAAVITAKDLETLGLAWMPTISYDTQAVLAGDKVRFQGQEVAFVIATDEYSARDALQLIDVDYDPLPAVVNARKALDPDAPLIRDDKDGPARQPRQPDLGGRRRGGHRPRVRRGRHGRRARHHLPALPPGAAGDVRDHRRLQPGDRPARHLQRQPGAARAPHGLRARRRARRAHDPDPLQRHRRRLRQQGAGLPGLRVRDRRLDRRRRAGQVDRGPLGEPDVDRASRATTSCSAEMCAKDGRITGLRVDVIADHGAFDSTAQPTKFPAGFFHIVLRLLRPAGVARQGQGGLHEQGARRRRLPLLVPHHRGRLPRRADGRRARARAGGRPDRPAHAQLHRARAVPVRDDHRLDVRLGRTTPRR